MIVITLAKVYWPNVLPQESEKMFEARIEKKIKFSKEFAWEQLESYSNKCQQFSKGRGASLRHHWSQKKKQSFALTLLGRETTNNF